jgi:hypothetical protein
MNGSNWKHLMQDKKGSLRGKKSWKYGEQFHQLSQDCTSKVEVQ